MARVGREGAAEPPFTGPVAVQWRDIERPDAQLPGAIDRCERLLVVDGREEPSDRGSAETEPGQGEARVSEWDSFGGSNGTRSSVLSRSMGAPRC